MTEARKHIDLLRERLVFQLLTLMDRLPKSEADRRWLILSERWSLVMLRRFPDVGGAW